MSGTTPSPHSFTSRWETSDAETHIVAEPGETAFEDHRLWVGAQRREKTRLRLLASALTVFADKGADVASIDEFIAAAGVSRGTFYNHFKTTNGLMLALATAMSDEVLAVVDSVVLTFSDPVLRFSAGFRLYMHMALRYPVWGGLLTRVGTRIATRGQLIDGYLTRDLELAHMSRKIKVDSVLVARNIVLGSIIYGIETMLMESARDHHPENLLRSVLIGLGLELKVAEAIAFMPLPCPASVEGRIFSALKPTIATESSCASPLGEGDGMIGFRRLTGAPLPVGDAS